MGLGTRELLDLILRWVHVIAGIMWIGNSLLFNWLDRNLRPTDGRGGSMGDIWLLHSGAFYQMEKTLLDGQALPQPLHWFKWQAYTTWLSGAVLLAVVYYADGGALLTDPAVSRLGTTQAIALGVGMLAGGWLVYDLIWRSALARATWPAALVSLALLVAVVYGVTQALSGRAAFLHVGAMLGTLMAGNVAMKIMPSQRQLVAAAAAGGRPDPTLAARAKQRSIHNNYMTFPVIVLMLSSHFPSLYGHRLNWLLLVILLVAGALVRHFMNVRFTYARWLPALGATVAVAVGALHLVAARPAARRGAVPSGAAAYDTGAVPFAAARSVIARRCASCHSLNPSDQSFGPAPAGVAFDTPEQIRALAERIHSRAVETQTMPPSNKTRITPEERALLARWIEQGARPD